MKKLEEILDLAENKAIIEPPKPKRQRGMNPESNYRNMSDFDKISAALPQVKGLGDISDTEFDELAQRATSAYDDLMDLGMNVEARYSARVFEVASSMLKNAIDARSAKVDKKLKMIELQLKKQKLDSTTTDDNSINVQGEGFIVSDRNSLLEKLKNMK
jgi:hypothetical protein